MKNILIPTALFLGFLLTSCSAEDEPKNLAYRETPQPETSEIIEEIQEVNSRFASESVRSRGSRGWRTVAADAQGAYEGSQAGGAIGGFIGSFFGGGGATVGRGVGSLLGGAIGAISYSYNEWHKTKGCGGIEDAPSIDEVTEAYCSVRGDLESGDVDASDEVYVDELEFPFDATSVKEIGFIHNGALAILMDNMGGGVMPLGNEIGGPEVPVESDGYQLTELEAAVLASDDYISYYEAGTAAIYNGDNCFTIASVADNVMKLYLDAIEGMSGADSEDITNLTNEYIAIVADSAELNEEDKESLYVAFSVAVYSYMYWSENY